MFKKNDNKVNDRIIYQAKPNLILGCKKAIFGFILLIIVLSLSGYIIQFIGKMQVYLISYIKLSLTRYVAIAMFVVLLIIVLYIIWQIIGWYSKEYILTDSKIIVKSGVLITRKNYMPYSTIQDINTSQSIFARLVNIGSISLYSAYDNNHMSLEHISNPSKVEEIIFSKMTRNMMFNHNQNYINPNNYYMESEDDYYDDVITPIKQEEQYAHKEYEYFPEDLNYNTNQRPKYEYEPYEQNLEDNINRVMSNYEEYDDNSHVEEDYLSQDYGDEELYYNENTYKNYSSNEINEESSESAIKRHFDKFKK